MVKITEPKKTITIEEINRVEKKYNIKLPNQYVEHLLKHNGGTPEPCRFKYKSKRTTYSDSLVDWFYAIYDGEYSNFEKNYDCFKVWQFRMPHELVPIADDPGGNQICIGISGYHTGKVYFWDHEMEADEGEPPTWDNVFLIANSFNEFLEYLH